MTLQPKWQTMCEALLHLENCTRYGARFITRSGNPTLYPYHEVLQRAQAVAGTLQYQRLAVGDRVAIILPTSIQFLDAFLGTQLAGGIPAALYPPLRLGRLTEYFTRTRRMLTKIGARFLITESRIRKLIGPAIAGVPSLERVFDAEELHTSASWNLVKLHPDTPAFLQFSSGTTLEPKAVIVSHASLLYNLEMMDSLLHHFDDTAAEQGGVCWLPLYHDMGLVGCMFVGLYHPGTVTYLGPELFLAKPSMWLQTLARYRAVISPAPNFAYGLCLAKIKDAEMEGIDLSNWQIAFNGAEPIDTGVLHRFAERFARWGFRPEALTPVYGLAEAGLAVTFSDPWSPPKVSEFDRQSLSERGEAILGTGRSLPAVGRPLPDMRVEIRDKHDRRLDQGKVGRIMIQGPSITMGYYNEPELTAQTIRHGWLDTGDLGFFYQGELYITGREKDLIIIRGRNYAPQEIEELLAGVQGLRVGCAVAVGHWKDGLGEQLLILAERDIRVNRPREEIVTEIQERILSGISLVPDRVEILEPGTLPRTSSGKLRRWDALHMFLSGRLIPPKKMGMLKLVKELGKSQIAWVYFRVRGKLLKH